MMINEARTQSSTLQRRVQAALDAMPAWRSMLFPFGFLIAPEEVSIPDADFPTYGSWPSVSMDGFRIHHHPDQTVFTRKNDDETLFLIGHALDPITMIHEEPEILRDMAAALVEDESSYLEVLNRLTGVFVTGVVDGDGLTIYGDAAGMQTAYYGDVGGTPYVASHAALVGILCDLAISDYVQRLIRYRFYPLFGRALPGDLSPYAELSRLVPNHRASWAGGEFVVNRFFPIGPILASHEGAESDGAVGVATDILRNSQALAAKKWEMPAISLTGGCDSQTTLACTVGSYEDFRYFSYVSSPEEEVDAKAAKEIADRLGLKHELIRIETDEIQKREDFEAISAILELNYGGIGQVKSSEVAKRIALKDSDIRLEIKSWVSEVARCYYHKRFLKHRFPKRPTPRYLTTLFKVFLHDRKLVRETDQVFRSYLEKYCSDGVFDRMDWWDLIFWEFRVGAWNGAVITGDHRFSFDIHIPYNNRLLLQALISTPVIARISDQPHREIRERTNPDVNELGVSVVNVKHTRSRSQLERVYLELHSRLPI